MDDQRKGPPLRNSLKQLKTHDLPTDDVENINSTNKRRELLLTNKPRIISWGTERILQRIQRHRKVT